MEGYPWKSTFGTCDLKRKLSSHQYCIAHSCHVYVTYVKTIASNLFFFHYVFEAYWIVYTLRAIELWPHQWHWPLIFKVIFLSKLYIKNGRVDWHGTIGMWVRYDSGPAVQPWTLISTMTWHWIYGNWVWIEFKLNIKFWNYIWEITSDITSMHGKTFESFIC